jgi:hypothetical protein
MFYLPWIFWHLSSRKSNKKEVRKMTWVTKGEKILAYELELADEAEAHYCQKCFEDSRPDGSSIIGYITKDDFETKEGQTLLCDGCGKEIEPY